MKKTAIFVSMLMALGFTTSAVAEQDTQAPQQTSPQTAMPDTNQAADFTNAELQKFADVQEELEGIRSDYSGRLESTENPDQAAQLQQEASQKMVQKVQEEGLDVETYSNIAMAIQSNPELRAKVQSMLN